VPDLTVRILGTLSRRIRQLEQPLDK
jgi:hypothetical protein